MNRTLIVLSLSVLMMFSVLPIGLLVDDASAVVTGQNYRTYWLRDFAPDTPALFCTRLNSASQVTVNVVDIGPSDAAVVAGGDVGDIVAIWNPAPFGDVWLMIGRYVDGTILGLNSDAISASILGLGGPNAGLVSGGGGVWDDTCTAAQSPGSSLFSQ